MKNLRYSEILKKNNCYEIPSGAETYHISVLGNVVVSQLKEILEYGLRIEGVSAKVRLGDYDNIIQDAEKFNSSKAIIVFWELCNITEGFQYKSNLMGKELLTDLIAKVKNEIDLFFSLLKKTSLVVVNRFSTLVFNHSYIGRNKFDDICKELNDYLAEVAPENTVLVDIDRVIAQMSVEKSVDFRYFYSSKTLYTVEFFKYYVEYIKPVILSVNGKSKKALILDCDNTLWKGVLGEDGVEGIKMSSKTNEGTIFEEVQSIALDMKSRGVLLGVCSKNNQEDVDDVLRNHPDIVLNEKNLVMKKVNWKDKATNIREISNELNIGLDSIVFLDDSDFEIGLVKELLPAVKTLKVPSEVAEYPNFVRKSSSLFFNISQTSEDLEKTKLYKAEIERKESRRKESRKKYSGLEEYLESLGLELNVLLNDKTGIPRLAQLTQKTNQFNLTTKRYTEADVKNFMNNPKFLVFSFSVKDKFGDNGVVGLCVVEKSEKDVDATLHSFLMSCRVIGRNVEFAFFDFLVKYLMEGGTRYLNGKYVKTLKNNQVSDFYDGLGFTFLGGDEEVKRYRLDISQYKFRNHTYINAKYGTES